MLFNLKATNFKRSLFFILSDALLSFFTLLLAYLLRFNFNIPPEFFPSLYKLYFLLLFNKILFLALFRMYSFTWRFFGLYELKRVVAALLLAYLAAAVEIALFYHYFVPFPRSALIIDFFLSIIFLNGIRALKRVVLESQKSSAFKRAAIYGATPRAKSIIESSHAGDIDYKIVSVIDDKKEGYISGIPIEKELKKSVDAVIFTKKTEPKKLNQLIGRYKKLGVKEFKNALLTDNNIENIDIEDLLAREPKDLDLETIKNFIKDKKIVITGAGGSIGSELVKQCEAFGAKQIVAVENSEFALYSLGEKHKNIIPVLCDVREAKDIDEVIKKHRPHIILHAAAYKHVPLAELNPAATVKTNVLGTKNVLDGAIRHGVERFVLISTDKAVNPTNIMGATKRVCELYMQNIESRSTLVSAVRFGNVLGSSGSVIPKFKEQILKGGPVTVTHPDIRRFFMLTSEACQLVLQAASISKGKEIFILDMGEPVKIVDLAKKMMELYNKEVPIEFIGLRPGEKLYEEILIEKAEKKTRYESIYIAKPTYYEKKQLLKNIENLLAAKEKEDIVRILKSIVSEFNHQPHL